MSQRKLTVKQQVAHFSTLWHIYLSASIKPHKTFSKAVFIYRFQKITNKLHKKVIVQKQKQNVNVGELSNCPVKNQLKGKIV